MLYAFVLGVPLAESFAQHAAAIIFFLKLYSCRSIIFLKEREGYNYDQETLPRFFEDN